MQEAEKEKVAYERNMPVAPKSPHAAALHREVVVLELHISAMLGSPALLVKHPLLTFGFRSDLPDVLPRC